MYKRVGHANTWVGGWRLMYDRDCVKIQNTDIAADSDSLINDSVVMVYE